MTTDKTPATLATAKHGGCVQLPTLERERFEAWIATQRDQGSEHVMAMVSDTDDRYQSPVTASMWGAWQAANATSEGGRINGWRMIDGIQVYSASAHASILDDQQYVRHEDYLAALSAQPSPGGQGDALLESLVARWRNHAEEIGVSDNLLCQKIAKCTMRHAAELQAALAARQPVGEPVAVSRMVSTAPEKIFLQIGDGDYSDEPFPHPVGEEITWCSDSIVESEVAYVRSDLAAPRAHTVDLSRFRSLARWVANSAGHGINSGQRRMGEELLALIDSQAVGNG
jgi:hypothetical protein